MSRFHPRSLRRSGLVLAAFPFALSTLAASVLAQTAPINPVREDNKLGTVVVTATRSPLNLSQVLADVTVLTRADIERQGFGNLADLLSRQSCVEIVRNGTPGTSTSLFVRGANTQHTLVLVDGVRMDGQSGSGGAALESIPLAQIERVEIVRGAASSIYGSDAVAAVIQVFTRKGKGAPSVELQGGFGSLGTFRGQGTVTGSNGPIDYAFTAGLESSDGFNIRPVNNDPSYRPDIDGWRQHQLQARIGAQLAPEHRVEWLSSRNHVDAAYDAAAKPTVGNDDRNLNTADVKRLLWQAQWSKEVSTEVSAGASRQRYETQTNGKSTYLTETEVRQYGLTASVKLPLGQLNLQGEQRRDELINAGLRPETKGAASRHQNAVAAAWLLNQGAFDAQLHLRHDQDSEFGGINTGTVATGWRLLPELRAWASAGTAFRAPTLYQIFSQYGPKPGVTPLSPEKGRNAELGLSWTGEQSDISLTVYRNRVSNLISWDTSFAANCTATNPKNPNPWDGCYGNLAKVRLQGLSLQGSTVLDGWRLSSNIDWQDPKDALTGKRLGRRAKLHGSVSADKQWGAWSAGAQLQASGRRFDNNANTVELGGYALLGLRAGYQLNKQTRLQLNIDNATDKVYETAKGYAQAPRTVFLSIRLTPSL